MVAKFVEFVQIVSADAALLISDSINSAHFFSFTPFHCASAEGGDTQDAVIITSEAAESGIRRFIGEWMEGESL